jgi:hypothetical protein
MQGIVLSVNLEHVHEELESIEKIVAKWRKAIDGGIAGVDHATEDPEMQVESFLRQFTGEMIFVSGKASNLAMSLSEQ